MSKSYSVKRVIITLLAMFGQLHGATLIVPTRIEYNKPMLTALAAGGTLLCAASGAWLGGQLAKDGGDNVIGRGLGGLTVSGAMLYGLKNNENLTVFRGLLSRSHSQAYQVSEQELDGAISALRTGALSAATISLVLSAGYLLKDVSVI